MHVNVIHSAFSREADCVCLCVLCASVCVCVCASACLHHQDGGREVAGRHRKFGRFAQMWFIFSVCAHVRQS